jgi:hypothetical protein
LGHSQLGAIKPTQQNKGKCKKTRLLFCLFNSLEMYIQMTSTSSVGTSQCTRVLCCGRQQLPYINALIFNDANLLRRSRRWPTSTFDSVAVYYRGSDLMPQSDIFLVMSTFRRSPLPTFHPMLLRARFVIMSGHTNQPHYRPFIRCFCARDPQLCTF